MNNEIVKEDKLLLDEFGLYLSVLEDVYIDRKLFILTDAQKFIKRADYENEAEYYSELIDYIISRL